MKMSLLSYLRKRKIDKRVKKFSTTSEYKTWNEVKSVLLLFESNFKEQNDDVRQLMWRLQDEGKKVSACMFVDVKVSPTMSRDNFVVLDRKSIGLFGIYKSDTAVNVVENEQFDLVLDLTTHLVYPLMYFMLDVHATMRCGKVKEELEVSPYDMQMEMQMPDFGDDEEAKEKYNERIEIAEQIIKYLKMIKK
ncbi:MAG: hypothetical protein KBT40_06700 [bacterium]|nr:hypothetical protein [Candidatus Minthenecus merdequi]